MEQTNDGFQTVRVQKLTSLGTYETISQNHSDAAKIYVETVQSPEFRAQCEAGKAAGNAYMALMPAVNEFNKPNLRIVAPWALTDAIDPATLS